MHLRLVAPGGKSPGRPTPAFSRNWKQLFWPWNASSSTFAEPVLIVMDNAMIVAYINKVGGVKSGSLCAPLWKLLSWCNLRNRILQACNIQGQLNVIADKLARQIRWSRLNGLSTRGSSTRSANGGTVAHTQYQSVCTKYKKLLLGGYAIPPTPLTANVINKILSLDFPRIIVITLGWPNMWFWDLVNLSSQTPLCLPICANRQAQPFNGSLHRDLLNLNLHA